MVRLYHLDFVCIQNLKKKTHFPDIYSHQVNGSEFAIISLVASENDFRYLTFLALLYWMLLSSRSDCWSCGNRIPESLPCLHDKVLAAAAEAAISFSTDQRRKQVSIHVFWKLSRSSCTFWLHKKLHGCRILQQGLLVASLKEWKARLKKMQKWEKFWHRTPSEHLESIFLKEPFAEPSIPNLDDPIELSIGS